MDAAPAPRTPPASRPFAPDALRLLAEARQESDRLRHEFIGIEHLVLAMTRHPHSAAAAAILAACGVGAHVLRQNGLTAEAACDGARATPRASP